MTEQMNKNIGWYASFMWTAMFVSYIDLIRLNLSWEPWSVILPTVTAINCAAWVAYWYFKVKKDWPMIIPNAIWVLLWITAAVTTIPAVVEFLGFA